MFGSLDVDLSWPESFGKFHAFHQLFSISAFIWWWVQCTPVLRLCFSIAVRQSHRSWELTIFLNPLLPPLCPKPNKLQRCNFNLKSWTTEPLVALFPRIIFLLYWPLFPSQFLTIFSGMTVAWVPTHSLWHTRVALISNERDYSPLSAFVDMLSAYNSLLYQSALPLLAFTFTSANLTANAWKNGCSSCSSYPLSLAAVSVEFVLNF